MKEAAKLRGTRCVGLLVLVAVILTIVAPVSAQKASAANGEKLFADKCIKCHDKDGSGGTPFGKAMKAADLRSVEVQSKTDTDFYTQIEKGKGNMPPFGDKLNKSQIDDLIAYVRQLGKNADTKKH